MGLQDWVDLKSLQAIFKHTVATAASVGSFILLTWLVEHGVGPGLFATLVELIEKVALVGLLLLLLINLGYDLWRELRRNVGGSNLILA